MPFLRQTSVWQRARAVVCSALAFLLLAFGPLAGPLKDAQAQTRQARESDLKAVFIFNFAQFVDWPEDSFVEENAPFVIGVIGNDPVADSLRQIIVNEVVRNRRLEVRHYHDPREIDQCHILFISSSESPRLDQIFEAIEGKPILTVGETDEFSARGGIIRFVVANSKLRLRISVESAKAANLVISSKLLRQAEIVEVKQAN